MQSDLTQRSLILRQMMMQSDVPFGVADGIPQFI